VLSFLEFVGIHTSFSTKSTGLFTKHAVTLDILGFAPIYLAQ
jgi:hypothetical protein